MQRSQKTAEPPAVFLGRGRPAKALVAEHGPILKKQATFYLDEKLCKSLRRSARAVGLSVSDLVTLAIEEARA